MKIGGLLNATVDIFMTAKQVLMKRGMTAVEKDQLRKPRSADPAKKKARSADPAKKKARKRNEASKRRNR